MKAKKRKLIGEILIEIGIIDKNQLTRALALQREYSHWLIGEVLVKMGFVADTHIEEALARQKTGKTVIKKSKPKEVCADCPAKRLIDKHLREHKRHNDRRRYRTTK